jgi:membrane-associated phospholipid phosphatase
MGGCAFRTGALFSTAAIRNEYGGALIGLLRRLGLRASEWVLIGFFGYIVVISPFFRGRPLLEFQPIVIFLGIFGLMEFLVRAGRGRAGYVVGIIRDWLPIALTLIAFREMELFLPAQFEHRYEAIWIGQDQRFLEAWHARAVIESLGKMIPSYLEFCYLLVYGLPAYCVAVLYVQRRRPAVDRFFTIYLAGTLGAYALFPYFPSQPPRIAFPDVSIPSFTTWIRALNLYLLGKATIHSGVFPSAHVSSAFSAAWSMFLVIPRRKAIGWGLLVYAISVSVATVYGRYHYAIDVLAGFGVSLAAGTLCVLLRSSKPNQPVQRIDNHASSARNVC